MPLVESDPLLHVFVDVRPPVYECQATDVADVDETPRPAINPDGPDAPFWWAGPILTFALSHRQLGYLTGLDGKCLVYASDASGADAPMFALKGLAESLRDFGVRLKVVHRFASEALGPGGNIGRSFLMLNHTPEILFTDMCTRKHIGSDFISGKKVPTPRAQIYVAGWVCVDSCSFNRSAKPLDLQVTTESGSSSKTLEASLFYVRTFRPALTILEHLYRVNTVEMVVRELRKIDGFAVEAFVISTQDFGMLTTRARLFIIAVDLKQCSLRSPIASRVHTLDACARCMPKFTLADFNDERAQQLVERMPAQVFDERGVPEAHHAVRTTLRLKHNLDVPTPSEMAAPPDGSPGQAACLPSREQDLINFHQWILRKVMGLDPMVHYFLWDISNNIEYQFSKHLSKVGVCPCFLTIHKIWPTKAQELVNGVQKMRIMGFPKTIVNAGAVEYGGKLHDACITDHGFHHLAGNTIAVSILGALFATALAEIDFERTRGPPGMKDNSSETAIVVGAMSATSTFYGGDKTFDKAANIKRYGFDPHTIDADPQLKNKRRRKVSMVVLVACG